MDSRCRHLVQIGDKLFSKKRQWDELNQEIAENFYPMRADWTTPFSLGTDFSEDLMESYPVQARETLANAISAMLRQGDWFAVKTGRDELDEDPMNAAWLEHATKRYRRLLMDRRSGFVRAGTEADQDYVAFGNPVLSMGESPNRDHLFTKAWHPRDCAWMENAIGQIDHVQRKMPMTARGIMARRDWAKNAHAEVADKAQKDPTSEIKVRHVVVPTDEVYGDDKARMRRYKDMPFLSLYIDCDHETILSESGLPVLGYVIPRWRTVSGWPYGFSPATVTSLPDGRMLQRMAMIILEQGEKGLDPPLAAKGEIFRDAVNLYPGGMTYVDLEQDQNIRDAIMPLYDGANIQIGLEMRADVRALIAESFMLNKLMLPNTREMREVEVQARLEEFRRSLLPFLGPIESEYHLPWLDMGFQIALKNNAFDLDQMPEALQGEEITFTFESPLNTAEGRARVSAFQESIQILGAAVQFDKSIVASINVKQMTKDAVKGTGAEAGWFASEEQELSAEEAEAQAAGLSQMAGTLREGAGVATDVANATTALQGAGLA